MRGRNPINYMMKRSRGGKGTKAKSRFGVGKRPFGRSKR